MDKNRAKLIKASMYASTNLCYHIDGRHKPTEDGYRITTNTAAVMRNLGSNTSRNKLVLEKKKKKKAPQKGGNASVLINIPGVTGQRHGPHP